MRHIALIISSIFLSFPFAGASVAEDPPVRIGVIASLSGFAAPYGQAVVNGAQVAKDELARKGVRIELLIEDDQSMVKQAGSAYEKLHSVEKVQALVGGSWWVNGIVPMVERDGIPFLSCETLYNKEFVKAPNYFSLAGDLREWIRVYEPVIQAQGWKTGMMVRFASGFADTLDEEWHRVFSSPGRRIISSLIYSDLEMTGARTMATRTVAARPDVIFVDAQPQSFATFAKELMQQGGKNVALLTHSVGEEALQQGLLRQEDFAGRLYFLRRSSYEKGVLAAFGRSGLSEPTLNADLGYYATRLLAAALHRGEDPVGALRAGLEIDGVPFRFDDNNVSHSIRQEVYEVRAGEMQRVSASTP